MMICRSRESNSTGQRPKKAANLSWSFKLKFTVRTNGPPLHKQAPTPPTDPRIHRLPEGRGCAFRGTQRPRRLRPGARRRPRQALRRGHLHAREHRGTRRGTIPASGRPAQPARHPARIFRSAPARKGSTVGRASLREPETGTPRGPPRPPRTTPTGRPTSTRRIGGPEGVAKGNAHSALKRTLQADDKAPEAKRMREAGRTQKEIAQAFDRTPRTIRYWFKREIGAVAAAVVERIQLAGGTVEQIAERLRRWKFAKGWSGTIHTYVR